MFNLLSILVTSHLREYNQVQDKIADISFGLGQGHTSLHVITPEQLREQLNLITQKLPTTLTLPQLDHADLRPLYRLMTTQGRVSGGIYLFKIQIPLLSENHFLLYHLIPVPVVVNNTQMTIKVTTKYLAVDLQKNQVYALTESELDKCITVTVDSHVCHQGRSLEDEDGGEHQCEAQLMLAKSLPMACTITKGYPKNTWISTGTTGSWLFSVSTPCDVTIICHGGITERMTLQDSGTLSLEKGCTMRLN